MKLTFPTKKFKYYDTYCYHLRLNFEMVNAKIELDPGLQYLAPAIFYFKINDKLALLDLSDYIDEYNWGINQKDNKFYRINKHYDYKDINVPIFRRTMAIDYDYPDNVFPYGPFIPLKSVQEYEQLISLKNKFDDSNRKKILHTNRIYAGANLTRKQAFAKIDNRLLLNEIEFETQRLNKDQHLQRLETCIGSLEVGSCPNAQGSGAIEGFLTGTPVISNNMDIVLPYNEKLEKDKHYIYIEEDYSNINEAINYVYSNRQDALEKAQRVYELFLNTWHPEKLVPWMESVVETYYDNK